MTGAPLSLLDNIRVSNGPEGLRSFFSELLHTDRIGLVELLNDRHLCFSTLYLLKSDIKSRSLQDMLSIKYKRALELADMLSKPGPAVVSSVSRRSGRRSLGEYQKNGKTTVVEAMRSDAVTVSSLSWIAETGWDINMPEGPYELLMERCTALLLAYQRERSILPAIADTIFERHRHGRLIHNLVWAFFEAHHRESLYMIAQRLDSPDMRDVILARKLLGFIPGMDDDREDGPALYHRALNWLTVNMPYICRTGESMQMCPKPLFYTVSYEAKYLCRQVSEDSGKQPAPLNELEAERLECFSNLDEPRRRLLADASCSLYMRDMNQWLSWFSLPIDDQLAFASLMTGGSA